MVGNSFTATSSPEYKLIKNFIKCPGNPKTCNRNEFFRSQSGTATGQEIGHRKITSDRLFHRMSLYWTDPISTSRLFPHP